MILHDITPLVLTWNEAPNLPRCLEALRPFPRVIVLDSFSTDDTEMIARSLPNACFAQRTFDNHTLQWNHGVSLVSTAWVLALDADYFLAPGFVEELVETTPGENVSALYAGFRYCVFGRPLRATLYPPRAVLFRKERCTYRQNGHTQLLEVNGGTMTLQSKIDHDDRKPLPRWIESQVRYARLEAEKLRSSSPASLSPQDRLRRTILLAPLAGLFYCVLIKGLFLDGWRGWYYTLQRTLAEIILGMHLLDHRLRPGTPEPAQSSTSKTQNS